jgi:methylmalonyl-CoA/ethylmalonyl-CoA epimerase
VTDKRLDHVGILVANLAEAVLFLQGTIGLEVVRTIDEPERNVRAAHLACGNAELELIEYTDPEVRRSHLGDETARIEHVAFRVSDADAVFTSLGSRGVEFTSATPLGTSKSFKTKPESSGGIVYQFSQGDLGT